MFRNYRTRQNNSDNFEELILTVEKIGFNKERENIFYIEISKRTGTLIHYDDRDIQTTENKSSELLELLKNDFNIESCKKRPEGLILKSKIMTEANIKNIFYCLEGLIFNNIQKFNMSQNYCSTVSEYAEQMNYAGCVSWFIPFDVNENRCSGNLDDFFTFKTDILNCRNIKNNYIIKDIMDYSINEEKKQADINPVRDGLGWDIFQKLEPETADKLANTGNNWGCHFFNGCEYLQWLEDNDNIAYYEDISWEWNDSSTPTTQSQLEKNWAKIVHFCVIY